MKQVYFVEYIDSVGFDMDATVVTADGKQYQVRELIDLVNHNKIPYESVKKVTIL